MFFFQITLSTAPTAVKAAASCYIDLIVKESDNNVKLIVLDRLIAMKVSQFKIKFYLFFALTQKKFKNPICPKSGFLRVRISFKKAKH